MQLIGVILPNSLCHLDIESIENYQPPSHESLRVVAICDEELAHLSRLLIVMEKISEPTEEQLLRNKLKSVDIVDDDNRLIEEAKTFRQDYFAHIKQRIEENRQRYEGKKMRNKSLKN